MQTLKGYTYNVPNARGAFLYTGIINNDTEQLYVIILAY